MSQKSLPTSLQVHQFVGLKPGPRLIVLGAVHGNETCGTIAIQRVLQEIAQGALHIEQGCVTFIPITNPLAYQLKQRQGERNLNRNLRITEHPQDYEDQIANALCPILAAHDILLDLHSFHTPGTPFALIGPSNNQGSLEPFSLATQESWLAKHLPIQRVVEGWLEVYELGVQRRRNNNPKAPTMLLDANYGIGTTEYMRTKGGYAITLECGQHEDVNAPEIAHKAIYQTLALLGISPQQTVIPIAKNIELIKLIDVIDREHVGDYFNRHWQSFDPVKAGELIGTRHHGKPVCAPCNGFVVFPNPQALVGNEWFYFAVKSDRRLE